MYPSRKLPQFNLRFSSHELKDFFAQQAKANHRTLTAEINFHLERSMSELLREQTKNATVIEQHTG